MSFTTGQFDLWWHSLVVNIYEGEIQANGVMKIWIENMFHSGISISLGNELMYVGVNCCVNNTNWTCLSKYGCYDIS